MLPPVPDYVGIIRRASVDEHARMVAQNLFARVMTESKPLSADHGSHHPRASDIGRCSLELLADVHGHLDLPREDDTRMLLDSGTLLGAYLAALFAGAVETFKLPYVLGLEVACAYRGSRGTIDVQVEHVGADGNPLGGEILEIKTTPGSGQIKPPDERKLYQCLQGAQYGFAKASERFTVLTWGMNVGNDKNGVPYPKMVAHTYATADFKKLVDEEIERLTRVSALPLMSLLNPTEREPLADAVDPFRCTSCRFSACGRNMNPSRFAL